MRFPAKLRPARPVLVLVGLIWVVELVQQLSGHWINQTLGLEPRSLGGLIGIPAMPVLHAGIAHAAANTLPLLILGAMGLLVAPRRFVTASVAIVIVSGLGVWLFARGNAIHVGASGLVFGWAAFLIALGVLERSWRALAGAGVVVLLYGGMFWGVLPKTGTSISWEAHLFGAAAGAATAWLATRRR